MVTCAFIVTAVKLAEYLAERQIWAVPPYLAELTGPSLKLAGVFLGKTGGNH